MVNFSIVCSESPSIFTPSRLTKCESELTIRADDKPEVVKERLDTYHEQTEPLKGYYEKKGKLISIEGQEELADTTKLTLTALGLT